jgi:hypothetical protein
MREIVFPKPALNPVPGLLMKRFLSISILLHAVVLLLLFPEIPLADRLLARSVVEVSLVERIEESRRQEGGGDKNRRNPLKGGYQGKRRPRQPVARLSSILRLRPRSLRRALAEAR